MTDNDRVLALLRERPEGVTPLDALQAVGTMRLAARVYDLRSAGHDIADETVRVETRDGWSRVKRYRLVSAP